MKWGEMMKRMENEQGGKEASKERREQRAERQRVSKIWVVLFFFKMKISK